LALARDGVRIFNRYTVPDLDVIDLRFRSLRAKAEADRVIAELRHSIARLRDTVEIASDIGEGPLVCPPRRSSWVDILERWYRH